MPLRGLLPGLRADQNRRAILAVVPFVVLVAYFRIKIPLLAGSLLFLGVLLGGVLLGLSVGDTDDILGAAATVTVLSMIVLYAVFLLDDFRLAREFGAVPPFMRADPRSFLLRLLLFGVVELAIVLALGFIVALTTFVGAWIGSTLRPILESELT